jgi:mono/diheme cytochrome c family protein
MKALRLTLIISVALLVLAAAFVYSGMFSVAADEPHWAMTERLLNTLRERSIAVRADEVTAPPSLDDPKLIANGAAHYSEMCKGCHLAPGGQDTEIRAGLYPKPPKLAEIGIRESPGKTFWAIKHGIKMTGMPAWGTTHDDEAVWSLVAFVKQLPAMSPEKYAELTAGSETEHSHEDGDNGNEVSETKEHHHDHGDHDHENSAAPATASVTVSPEAAGASAVVDRFQSLLAAGKTREASALLDNGVLIFESGGAEKSRAEYASHHLGADAEFLKSAKVKVDSRVANAAGDFAWVATESTLHTAGAKPAHLASTETMVLKRFGNDWRIVHVHWSSAEVKH